MKRSAFVTEVLSIGVIGLLLGGCAAQQVLIRTLPPETPAADNAAAIKSAAQLAEAAAATKDEAPPNTPAEAGPPIAPVRPADAPPMYTDDPWEPLNRFIYRFNAKFDEALFLPVANQYRRLPSPIRVGVHNFFVNLSEVKTTVNYAVQFRLRYGARSLSRFVINSTLGIGGLIDVAKTFKLPNTPTGFTTTLSKWGVHQGPYLVIPFLGPSTLRDGVGLLGDFGIGYGVNVADLYRGTQSWALDGVDAVNVRANTGFRYYSTGSPFEYETIRFLYVRKGLIEDEALRARSR